MRHVYLAATGQNRGKTTVSLGVLDGFGRRGISTGFCKPVGQRTVIEEGVPADEDAVLMKAVFGLSEPLGRMSPVHIPRGFTQAHIDGKVVEDLPARIRDAHASFTAERDMLLIEGTGHAGVGAVINLSNADVASMLGAPAVIVSEGGVGRPIDEIVLNKSLFERSGVQVAGAIVNKVDLLAKPDLARTLERGLQRHGIRLLGVLPYRPILSNPTLAMVLEGVHGETIHPGPDLDQVIGGVSIGAMEPQHMLQRIGPRALVIVPGDREDVIAAIVHAHRIRAEAGGDSLGLVLTGGYRPRQTVLDAIRYADLFATIVDEDTYQVASEVHDLLVKTHASDAGKIAEIKALVLEHLFIDRILEVATEARV
jgi:BioD-like phosphotransacetylase family protein